MHLSLPIDITTIAIGAVAGSGTLAATTIIRFRRGTNSRNKPRVPPWLWLFLAYAVAAPLLLLVAVDQQEVMGISPGLLALILLALPVAAFWSVRQMAGFSLVARVGRRADRGDLDGAIAQLQAAIDRHPIADLDAGPAPFDPANPWAPPASAAAGNPRAAARLNALGILQARRGDWPAALGCFERADRIGRSEPIYSLNRGEALIMVGNPGEGLHVAIQAIDQVPKRDPLKRYSLSLSLARTLLDAGHGAAAVAALDGAATALRRSPILLASTRARLNAEIETVRLRVATIPTHGPRGG